MRSTCFSLDSLDVSSGPGRLVEIIVYEKAAVIGRKPMGRTKVPVAVPAPEWNGSLLIDVAKVTLH
jgi:hypothetical protein